MIENHISLIDEEVVPRFNSEAHYFQELTDERYSLFPFGPVQIAFYSS